MRTSTKPVPARARPDVQRPSRRILGLSIALLVLAIGSLFYPPVFQQVFGIALKLTAWRQGASVEFARVEGSFFAPVTLHRSLWTFGSETGATTRVEIVRTEAQLAWRALFGRTGSRWFQRLSVRGVSGKVFLPGSDPAAGAPARGGGLGWQRWRGGRVPFPVTIEAQDMEFIFQSGAEFIRLDDCRLNASELEPGTIRVARLTIKQPWLTRTFRAVEGTTGLNEQRLVLGNVALEPGVEIRSLSAALNDLAAGRLNLKLQVAAFGGEINAEARTPPAQAPLAFEAGGTFTQIDIAKCAAFLGLSEAAGGTIKVGDFNFRGSPRNPATATARLRLEATNFQWETRQWDALSVGVMLMDRRVQVPQLDLRQGKNTLTLSGELSLPAAEQKWWGGEFNCAIKARIDNLTELSALLLPEFKYAAGKVSIDGQVRGRGEDWDGQLLLEGSRLTWRNAPIETVHAAAKISGKELRVARIELVNGDDYLRGNGVVNLFGPTQYWGELRVAVEDLAAYAAFLEKPVLPEPLAGGAIIDWTGEGSAQGQSGRFVARLRKVRPLGARASQLHPINAALEGTYAAGAMEFSTFALSDDNSSFTANVTVGNQALNVSGIRLRHRDALWLEGDALLPFDVWQQWPNVSLAQLLTEDVVSRVDLTAHGLDLAQASQLTGWKFPIAGIVDGRLSGEGPINALKVNGELTLTGGVLPFGWNGDTLSAVEAKVGFAESTAQLDSFTAHHRFGDLAVSGSVQLADIRAPVLQLTVTSPFVTLPLFRGTDPGVSMDARLDLEVSGPLPTAAVKGRVAILSVALDATPDLTLLWRGEKPLVMPPLFSFPAKPWADWRFDLAATPADGDELKSDTSEIHIEVRVTGTGEQPLLAGAVEMANVDLQPPAQLKSALEPVPLAAEPQSCALSASRVAIKFVETMPTNPSLDLELVGELDKEPFRASAAGPLSHLIRIYESRPPLTDAAIRELLSAHPATIKEDFISSVPAAADAPKQPELPRSPVNDAPEANGSPSEPTRPEEQ